MGFDSMDEEGGCGTLRRECMFSNNILPLGRDREWVRVVRRVVQAGYRIV